MHYTVSSASNTHPNSTNSMSNPVNARTIEFLLQPELLWCQIKFSSTSLSQQLFNPNRNINKNKFFSNSFSLLTPNIDSDENIVDIDDQLTPTKQTPPTKNLSILDNQCWDLRTIRRAICSFEPEEATR
jgi:hypothetical protein